MSTQPDFDTMTDAELANYHYTHRDSPLGDDSDLEEVAVEIAVRAAGPGSSGTVRRSRPSEPVTDPGRPAPIAMPPPADPG